MLWLMPSEEGYLEPEGLEKTWRIKQESIVREVDIISSRKAFDIVLPVSVWFNADLGPYIPDYTLNGRYMVIAGRKGHLAIIDTKTMGLFKEFQDFCREPLRLQFLRKHFLLVSINKYGQLHYHDITTGETAGNHRTGLGRCDVMQVNPFNAVLGLGHNSGKVTMWKPTSSAPLVTMLCHHGPVSAVAFHNGGHLMATAGMDQKVKLWDLRKFQVLQSFSGHARTLGFSQKGLLALGNGSLVQVWRDSSGDQNYSRYMSHSMVKGYQVGRVSFQPYEDVLCLGHSTGISSILIPGSGEPNFDSWVANPFETTRQRREKEVHDLLNKLPAESIMLDPSKIGLVKTSRKEQRTKQEREAEMEAAVMAAKNGPIKKKTKGRNKPSKREKKKHEAVERAKKRFFEQEIREAENESKKRKFKAETEVPKSLQRFVRKTVE
ncbi:hypothetical protein ACLOJK_020906 [Asimina triloba]